MTESSITRPRSTQSKSRNEINLRIVLPLLLSAALQSLGGSRPLGWCAPGRWPSVASRRAPTATQMSALQAAGRSGSFRDDELASLARVSVVALAPVAADHTAPISTLAGGLSASCRLLFRRRCLSTKASMTCAASYGAETDPQPPCSHRTATAMSGLRRGAIPTNQELGRSRRPARAS